MRRFAVWLFDRLVDLELWSAERSRAFKAMCARWTLKRKIARGETLKKQLREVVRKNGASS